MKRYIILIALTALALSGCRESVPDSFGDIRGVYFNNLLPNRSHTDSIGVTFIYEDKDVIDIPVRIQLLGRPSDQDRPISISLVPGNAAEGKDYVLPGPAVLEAGATTADYVVRLCRTPELKTETRKLVFHLEAGGEFILPFRHFEQAGGHVTSADTFIIEYSDQFTAPPAGWNAMFAGTFSQQKFELITRVMEIPRSDFNDKDKISAAKWIYIQEQMTLYVRGEVKKKENGEPYDPEAFDENGDPLVFHE